MRLTILGGSGASPNTGAGCSGYLIQTDATTIALDLGPGTLPELRRYADHRRLDAVVISHLHLDHVLDVITLQVALAYNPVPPPRPVPIWLPPNGIAWLRGIWAAIGDYDEAPGFFLRTTELQEYEPSDPLHIGDLVIRFTPTIHYVPCWAMRISRLNGQSGGDLAYTADTGPSADLPRVFAGAHALLAEATLIDQREIPLAERRGLTAHDAGQLATSSGVDTLILTHVWEEHGFESARLAAAATYSGQIEMAAPGLTVDW